MVNYKKADMIEVVFIEETPIRTFYHYRLICPACIKHTQCKCGDCDCKNTYTTPECNEGQCCCYSEEHN